MNIFQYLPSAQFALIATSVALSGVLVVAAEAFTNSRGGSTSTLAPSELTVGRENSADWLQTLRDIQAQNSSYALPTPPSASAVQTLLDAATGPNVTDTVSRTLLINLSDAKAQGLGGDIPTQDKLIADAAAQIAQGRGAVVYTPADLISAANTPETLRAYGNNVMATMALHTKASYYDTLLAVGFATDYNDKTKLAVLPSIGAAYKNLSVGLSKVPVPQTLIPLHLQIVNNFARISGLYENMQEVLDDPLRGLGGLELYESLMQETSRVFTNIAQQLSKNGILFTTDEPGNAWSSLLP